MKLVYVFVICALVLTVGLGFGQPNNKFNYAKVSALCLDANVKMAIEIINASDQKELTKRDSLFVQEIKRRFASENDESEYLSFKRVSFG
jgi:hypothetical protein